MSFQSAFSANAVAICQSCGVSEVVRLEPSRRFRVVASESLSATQQEAFAAMVRMLAGA